MLSPANYVTTAPPAPRAVLLPATWSPELERHVALACLADRRQLDFWRQAVADRRLEPFAAFLVDRQGIARHIASALFRWDRTIDGLELTLIGVGGEPGHNITRDVLPLCEAYARERGAVSVCFHTARCGLEELAYRAGYEFQEVVLRKPLARLQ